MTPVCLSLFSIIFVSAKLLILVVPVYDGRVKPLCFETDLGQLASVLEPYEGPIPYGSFVVVGYTAAVYRSSKDQSWTLACNVQWVIVLGTPDE